VAKERIDVVLARKGYAPSREKARAFVMAGQVYINNERIAEPDKKISEDAQIEIKKNPIPFVSYGGLKLNEAIKAFGIPVKGRRAIDVGSSTGGFVDCLLQNGATLVYAIDTGTHQLHDSLRRDRRVILKENCNARYLVFEDIGEKADIITIDVSFISLKKILPVIIQFMSPDAHVISLVKPQFEVGRFQVGKGGIVKDTGKINRVMEDIMTCGRKLGLTPVHVVEAPRERKRKNREFFILWALQEPQNQSSSLPA